MRLFAAPLVGLVLLACTSGPSSPAPPAAAVGTRVTEHFVWTYPVSDAAAVDAIARGAEQEQARVVADLGVDRMPLVRVTFYADHAALEAATRAVAGVVPAWASGLVTSETAIHMMSPGAPGWGPVDRVATNVVHEFAHCVSLHVNPRIANNPRWYWESVAIYEARQQVDLRTVPYMAALAPPPFATLNAIENTRVYDVGYSIAEFAVSRWGTTALARLLATTGDTAAAFGIPLGDFERDWFAFVRERYSLG